jgi:hypothetical protein
MPRWLQALFRALPLPSVPIFLTNTNAKLQRQQKSFKLSNKFQGAHYNFLLVPILSISYVLR